MKPDLIFLKSSLQGAGGLEKASYSLIEASYQKGYKPLLLTMGPIDKAPPHLPCLSLGALSKNSYKNLLLFDKQVNSYLQDNPCPIVMGLDRNFFQTHYRAGNGVHQAYLQQRIKLQPKLGLPWLEKLSLQLSPFHRALLKIEKTAFTSPHLRCLITNSHMVRQEILSYYDIDPARIEVIHNGVSFHATQQAFDETFSSNAKQLLGLDPNSYQFLFVGHGYKRKGVELLLRALSPMAREPWQLTIVGKERSLSYFQKLAASLQIGHKVFFRGIQANILPYYQAADALVLPSLYDPFANVTVEALAMGLYVVTSCHNGGHEVLLPHLSSTVYNLANPDELEHSLRKALLSPKTASQAATFRNSICSLDEELVKNRYINKIFALQ